jgi:NosR/NirI family nitrous oxide reductase transcriptional regulator
VERRSANRNRCARFSSGALAAWVVALLLSGAAFAAGFGAYKADVKLEDVFQGADRFGPREGTPPAIAAYRNGSVIGYVFETSDIGYSGKPIRILAGIDKDGTFTGAKVIEHHEPILLVGISPDKLFDFVARHAGRNVIEMSKSAAAKTVDVISGATVTAVVISDGLMRTALAVAKSRGIGGFPPPQQRIAAATASTDTLVLADVPFEKTTWTTLLGDGSVRRLHLLNREVDEAFAKIGVGSPEPYAKAGVPDEDFIDFYAGLASVETIGRSLLTPEDHKAITSWLGAGNHALILAANGDYSFRGSGFVRGGIFDRIQLIQDDQTILFKDKDHRRIDRLDLGNPEFKEIGIFRIPAAAKFDPAKSFRIELLAQRPIGPIEKAFTSFSLSYQLPSRFLKMVAAAPPMAPPEGTVPAHSPPPAEMAAPADQLWVKIWNSRAIDVTILGLALTLLTFIFFFQDWLVQHRVLFGRLRAAFLLFSVLWLGLYAKAQLSVVNVLTFANAMLTGFRWEYFLLEPLIFILWCATAASLLFWGRGAYCGWLCPFGALQELLNHGARRIGIRQVAVPFYLHERLWALKYILFLGLFGVSLGSMAFAEQLAEIEPFKTVVLLRFMREWWFVLFALALLTAGLFIERFYCRYLCVLGAALAIPGRGRMFDWLKRRKQCGIECQLCAKECTVEAIHPLGEINPNECIYCMHCQVVYWDDHKCPPLVMKREGRGKKSAAPSSTTAAQAEPADKRPPAHIKVTVNSKEIEHVEN